MAITSYRRCPYWDPFAAMQRLLLVRIVLATAGLLWLSTGFESSGISQFSCRSVAAFTKERVAKVRGNGSKPLRYIIDNNARPVSLWRREICDACQPAIGAAQHFCPISESHDQAYAPARHRFQPTRLIRILVSRKVNGSLKQQVT